MEMTYNDLKDRLLMLIDESSVVESVSECPCDDLREKLIRNRFNLVVVGQFKRGKTTFINSLLGADILPTAVVPLTSIVTVIEHGPKVHVNVTFNDGTTKEVPPDDLPEYVTEKGNPKNEKDVAEVVIKYPSAYLKDGVRLIDTPGVGSVYQHNTDVAYEYLPRSDATVFLISVDQPLSKAEVDFLKDVRQYSDRIFFLQNKADYLTPDELVESLEYTRTTIENEVGYTSPELYPVSAKFGLEGKLKGDNELLKKSNLPAFEERLYRFLIEEKGMILIRSVSNNLLRVISEAVLRTELLLKSLQSPLEEIERKLRAFEEKHKEIESDKRDFEILLEGEAKRITAEMLDPDLEEVKREISEKFLPEFDGFYQENKALSPGKLRKTLESFIVQGVKESYSIFRKNEDTKISLAFEKVADRFIKKINTVIDELLRYSSELFSIKFESFSAEALWSMKSGFYYKFKDEQLMIEMLGEALTSLMPRFVSNRIVRRTMKKYLLEMIERQSGRIRWDFIDRLQKSRLEFRWQMLGKIDETVKGIGEAVRKGLEERKKGEETARKREVEVKEELDRLYILKEKILKTKESTGPV
ncbi:bacterial dynamin-like protein [bacterium BMS3Abin07]|nr:bacterial dynamin-like protein [bacterium BMS3Abin07]GBE33122.1 bacterial dynamin-like protein [bacterium BMS3Bbin05]HDL19770.1 dynamin [Nitrospirota bacterium]HDO22339.1 dynamin [Nitrospirota bacterium]